MSETNVYPKTFELKVERLSETLIFAESPQIPGLHMSGRTYKELFRKLPIVIEALHQAKLEASKVKP